MLLIMLMTNKRAIMGDQVNSAGINVLGYITTGFICGHLWADHHLVDIKERKPSESIQVAV
jgi:hypothetical protein